MANEILRPNGAGNETSITSQFPDSTYHWDKVDEAVADEDTTYVLTSNIAYLRDTYAIENPSTYEPGDTITNVRVTARCKEITSGGKLKLSIRTHSNNFEGSEQEATTDYADYTEDGAVYDKEHHEKKWDEINTAMSWITEELGLEYNEEGDYVDAR